MDNKKIKVIFFPATVSASCCGPSAAASSCDCGPVDCEPGGKDTRDPNEILLERLRDVEGHFVGKIETELANYSSNAGIFQAIDNLNYILQNNGKSFMVTPANFYTFISSVAPIISVNGQLTFTRMCPIGINCFKRLIKRLRNDP